MWKSLLILSSCLLLIAPSSWSFVVLTRTTPSPSCTAFTVGQRQRATTTTTTFVPSMANDFIDKEDLPEPHIKILANSLVDSLVEDNDVISKIPKSSDFFNDADRQTLKDECAAMIDKAIKDGLIDLNKLRDKYQRDILTDGSMTRLEQAMILNGIQQSKKFDTKVDTMVGTFLNNTAVDRQKTRMLALEDQRRIEKEEREKRDKEKKKKMPGTTQSWKKTNDAWDAWDDW